MEGERNGNGNTVLLTVIGVATLLVALVGATFAYFSATITNNQQQSVILTTAAPVGLEYVGGTITLNNIVPGASESGTFTVTNPAASTVAQTYDLELKIDKNELNTNTTEGAQYGDGQTSLPGQLLVTVSGSSTTASSDGKNTTVTIQNCGTAAACDFTDSTANPAGTKKVIVDNQRIEVGEVQTYLVNVNFAELDVNQNANMNKAFQAHIEIADATSVR
ncbi:MAG TPA: hypothetical protein DCY94_01505 [Firmicutes bacterium]|nr:hypothetical protein [Bacillota bacterium]